MFGAVAVFVLLAPAHGAPLARLVRRELRDPALEGAAVSVWVEDHRGRVRVDEGGTQRLVPASTVKWLTAMAAADVRGLDHRFRTRVQAAGVLDGDTLVGDLVLVGDGDPSFALEDPEVVFEEVPVALRELGIREVTGGVVVADDVIGDGPLGTGWMWDDLRFAFSAPFGAVNLGHNLPQRGTLDCETIDGPGTPLAEPDRCAAKVLDAALRRGGIALGAEPREGPRPEVWSADVVVWESPPLRELLRTMLQDSDNLYAEGIVRLLDHDGVRTFRGARIELERVLEKAGIAPGTLRLADGSGLSRYAFVSAEALVRATRWALEQPWGEDLRVELAQLGVSGTLEDRGRGTPADGRVWAKTGSMSGVRNIVGVAYDAKDRPVYFGILLNGLTAPRDVVIALQDRILALLAVSRGPCVRRRDRIAVLGEGG